MFIAVSTVLMFPCIPAISSSFSSLCFCLDAQSAVKRSRPGLYIILTLHWCIMRSIHCSPYSSVATSFLNITSSGLWCVIILISLASSSDGICPGHVIYLMLLFLYCVYLFSALDRLLLVNAMALSMLLSSAISLGQLVPFHICSRLATSPTPDASVSKCSDLVLS